MVLRRSSRLGLLGFVHACADKASHPVPLRILIESDLRELRPGDNSECSERDDNCISKGCCRNSSLTCFAKTSDWGRCLESCTPGIHDDEAEEFREPWSCATAVNFGCSREGEDCGGTGCCYDPGATCFVKNANWSACKLSCEPGIHEDDDAEFRTPWECTKASAICQEAYQQCGGQGWTGPTCCKSGCHCQRTSAFYHQCARTDVKPGENNGQANTCYGVAAPAPPTRPPTPSPEKKSGKGSGHERSSRKRKEAESDRHFDAVGEATAKASQNTAEKGKSSAKAKPAPAKAENFDRLTAGSLKKSSSHRLRKEAIFDDEDDEDEEDDVEGEDEDYDVRLDERLPREALLPRNDAWRWALLASCGLGLAILIAKRRRRLTSANLYMHIDGAPEQPLE